MSSLFGAPVKWGENCVWKVFCFYLGWPYRGVIVSPFPFLSLSLCLIAQSMVLSLLVSAERARDEAATGGQGGG